MIKSLGLSKKIISSFFLISFAGLGAAGYLTYLSVARIAYESTLKDLDHQMDLVEKAIVMSYEDNLDRVKSVSGHFRDMASTHFTIDTTKLIELSAENQVTHEKIKIKVPLVLFDGKPLEDNHSYVDRLLEETGSVATLLVKTDVGYVRVTTSVKKSDGSRAIHTFIPNGSPVIAQLEKNLAFYGRAQVVGTWYATAYEPILDSHGKIAGTFFVGQKDSSYQKAIELLKGRKLLQSGYFFAFESKGNMMLHPTLESKNVLEMKDLDGDPIFQTMLAKKNGVIEYRWKNADTKEEQSKLALFKYLDGVDWVVAASLNKAEVLEDAHSVRNVLIITIGTALFFMLLVAWFVVRAMTKSLDEIAAQMGQTTMHVSDESKKVAVAAASLSDGCSRQSSALIETVATVDEFAATIAKNTESAKEAEQAGAAAQAAVTEGVTSVNSLDQAIERMNVGFSNMQTRIEKSFQDVNGIISLVLEVKEKTKMIHDIVFQTKLLSFNASVEAARAGEHGKGFAVVAEEIGKLASMTGTSASSITQQVSLMVDRVQTIVNEAGTTISSSFVQSSDEVNLCVAEAKRCLTGLGLIRSSVEVTHSNVEIIARASEEQANAITQLGDAIRQIDLATQNNANLAVESDKDSKSLQLQSTDLKRAMMKLLELKDGAKRNVSDVEENFGDEGEGREQKREREREQEKTRVA